MVFCAVRCGAVLGWDGAWTASLLGAWPACMKLQMQMELGLASIPLQMAGAAAERQRLPPRVADACCLVPDACRMCRPARVFALLLRHPLHPTRTWRRAVPPPKRETSGPLNHAQGHDISFFLSQTLEDMVDSFVSCGKLPAEPKANGAGCAASKGSGAWLWVLTAAATALVAAGAAAGLGAWQGAHGAAALQA